MAIILDGSNGIDSPDLNIVGVGARITGDFTNATASNRVMFKTSTPNQITRISAVPDGTGSQSALDLYNSSDPNNSSIGVFTCLASEVRFNSSISGTGTYLPFTFLTSNIERLRIDTAGIVTVTGELRATNEITAYYSSDLNLKENIVSIENALYKVNTLRGVMFDWSDDYISSRGGEDGYFVRKHDTGIIAQEVELVLPEVVVTRDDGTKAVKYEKMIGLIIEAINELSNEVKLLKEKV